MTEVLSASVRERLELDRLDRKNNSIAALHQKYLEGEELPPGPLTKILHLLSEEEASRARKMIQQKQAAFWQEWTPFRCGLGDEGGPTFDSIVNILPVRAAFARSVGLEKNDLIVDLMGGSGNMAEYFLKELKEDIAGYVTIDSNPLIVDRAKRQLESLGIRNYAVIEHDLSNGLPEELGAFIKECGPERIQRIRFVSNWGITYLEALSLLRLVAECFDNERNCGISATLNLNMLTNGRFNPEELGKHFIKEIVPAKVSTLQWKKIAELINAVRAIPQIKEFGKKIPSVVPIWYPEEIQELLATAGFRVINVDDSLLWGQSTVMEVVPAQAPTMLY